MRYELAAPGLSALPPIAEKPLAIAGSVVLIGAWLVVATRGKHNKQLLSHLKDHPAPDRLNVLQIEMGQGRPWYCSTWTKCGLNDLRKRLLAALDAA